MLVVAISKPLHSEEIQNVVQSPSWVFRYPTLERENRSVRPHTIKVEQLKCALGTTRGTKYESFVCVVGFGNSSR